MSIRVRIEHGQGAGTTWRLTQPGVYLLGRAKSCSIQVLDLKVSKEHCEIHLAADGESAMLHDVGSAHGYTLNGQPKKGDNKINAGDELRLGLSILRILSDGAADHEITPVSGRSADSSAGAAKEGAVTKTSLPPDELVGKELSGYRVERKIGMGGMGGVYLAEQISLKRQVALKVLNERFGSDSAFVDQFVNEARAAGALNHPNVVQVYDVGSADGHYFFSMEVMPGGSIEDRVKADGAIPWAEALNWFLDAANALIFAHKKEILHRDVKPDNLMVAEDGSAKLCDLGLAKKSESADLMDQGIIGTPHFISPEAIRRKPDIDHRTDLYSLGCSFYRVLTGGNPYPGKTVKEILLGHLNTAVPRISAKQNNIPRDLDDVVHTLMQKAPDDRIQTPEDLLAALDKVRLRHGLESHGIRPHSRKPMLIAAAVALLAIVGGVYAATRPDVEVLREETVEQKEAAKRTAIRAIKNKVDLERNAVESQLIDWERELIKRDLRSSEKDNWKDSFWAGYIQEHRDTATEWEGFATKWLGEVPKQTFDEAKTALTEGAAFITDKAKTARELADKHAKYIDGRKKNESAIRTARTTAKQEFATAILDHKKKVEVAFADGKFLEVAVLLRGKTIDDIVTPFRTKEKLEVKLLDGKKIDETVKKDFGALGKEGPFTGWYGIKRLKEARAALQQAFNEAMQGASIKDDAPIDEMEAGEVAIAALIERLPKDPTPDAGALNDLLVEQRADAKTALRKLTAKRVNRMRELYAGDKIAMQAFIEKVFAPRSAGGSANLRLLGLLDASLEANALAQNAKMPEYKMVSAHWKRATTAVKSAIEKAIATFPKEWTSTKFVYTDERGREKHKTFKEVTETGFTLNRETERYAERTPAWLVENLFRNGDEARFAIAGEEVLGLAMLAELGARFDLAKTFYETYLASAPTEAKAGVTWRLSMLANEKEAAGVWLRATEVLDRVETFLEAFDPGKLGEAEFAKKADELFNGATDLAPQIAEAQALLTRLRADARLASTIWGAAVRDGKAHPEATFAGEPLIKGPAPVKKDEPVKKDGPDVKDGPVKKEDPKKGDDKLEIPKDPNRDTPKNGDK